MEKEDLSEARKTVTEISLADVEKVYTRFVEQRVNFLTLN